MLLCGLQRLFSRSIERRKIRSKSEQLNTENQENLSLIKFCNVARPVHSSFNSCMLSSPSSSSSASSSGAGNLKRIARLCSIEQAITMDTAFSGVNRRECSLLRRQRKRAFKSPRLLSTRFRVLMCAELYLYKVRKILNLGCSSFLKIKIFP